MPGSLSHLAKRLVDFVTVHPVADGDVELVRSWLSPAEAEIFFAQSYQDQAHGFQAGSYVADRQPERHDLIRAATLHDVGKRHANLGALGRSLASLAIKANLPMSPRMELYRDHPRLGADELREAGSSETVMAFTRWHHRARPDSISSGDWKLLVAADEPPKPMVRRHPR